MYNIKQLNRRKYIFTFNIYDHGGIIGNETDFTTCHLISTDKCFNIY